MLPPEGAGEEIKFVSTVRSPVVLRPKDVIKNNTMQNWVLRPVVSSAMPFGLFSGSVLSLGLILFCYFYLLIFTNGEHINSPSISISSYLVAVHNFF